MESDKDTLLYQLIEGEKCWLPSYIKLFKSNPQWKRELYIITRDDDQLYWLAEEFKSPLMIDIISLDMV